MYMIRNPKHLHALCSIVCYLFGHKIIPVDAHEKWVFLDFNCICFTTSQSAIKSAKQFPISIKEYLNQQNKSTQVMCGNEHSGFGVIQVFAFLDNVSIFRIIHHFHDLYIGKNPHYLPCLVGLQITSVSNYFKTGNCRTQLSQQLDYLKSLCFKTGSCRLIQS